MQQHPMENHTLQQYKTIEMWAAKLRRALAASVHKPHCNQQTA
jgi:hypothetical protein